MNRTDPEYLALAEQQAWEDDVLLTASKAAKPPETLEDPEDILADKSCGCWISEEAKEYVELIRASEDPAKIIQALPFEWEITEDDIVGWVYWILPRRSD